MPWTLSSVTNNYSGIAAVSYVLPMGEDLNAGQITDREGTRTAAINIADLGSVTFEDIGTPQVGSKTNGVLISFQDFRWVFWYEQIPGDIHVTINADGTLSFASLSGGVFGPLPS